MNYMNFFMGLITASSLLCTLTFTYIFHLSLIRRDANDKIQQQINEIGTKLTYFRQLCHYFYSSPYCMNTIIKSKYEKNKLNRDGYAFNFFEAINNLQKKLYLNAYTKDPFIEYSVDECRRYKDDANKIWFVLIDEHNSAQVMYDVDLKNEEILMEDTYIEKIVNELSPYKKVDKLNYISLGEMAGEVEISVVDNMLSLYSRKISDNRGLVYVLGIIFFIGTIIPLFAMVFNWNNFVLIITLLSLFVVGTISMILLLIKKEHTK